jgi:hypothetical protein
MPPKRSIRSLLVSLAPEQRDAFLTSLSTAERAMLAHSWSAWARPSQLPPPGDWRTWLFLAGRGAGKTRAGAEWVRWLVEEEGAMRIALVERKLGNRHRPLGRHGAPKRRPLAQSVIVAQRAKTTQLYDRRRDDVTLDEVVKINIRG